MYLPMYIMVNLLLYVQILNTNTLCLYMCVICKHVCVHMISI